MASAFAKVPMGGAVGTFIRVRLPMGNLTLDALPSPGHPIDLAAFAARASLFRHPEPLPVTYLAAAQTAHYARYCTNTIYHDGSASPGPSACRSCTDRQAGIFWTLARRSVHMCYAAQQCGPS
jgi:hypothetical protein